MEELERDNPIYDAVVPVKIRQGGRDERVAELTIRVVMGVRVAHGQRDRLMHIELTDDADMDFLFALDVTEEEFHELKQVRAQLFGVGVLIFLSLPVTPSSPSTPSFYPLLLTQGPNEMIGKII